MERTELGHVAILREVAVGGNQHVCQGNAPARWIGGIIGGDGFDVSFPIRPVGEADQSGEEVGTVSIHDRLIIARGGEECGELGE